MTTKKDDEQKLFFKNPIKQYIILITLGVVVFIISISSGKFPITLTDILRILTGQPMDSLTRLVFLNLRLPRVLMTLLSGIGLSLAGSVYQTIFKNPLATPDLIGVASGANLGAAIAIIFFAGNTLSLTLSAFIGGFIAVMMALSLTQLSRDKSMTHFILAGIVISSLTQGVIMLLKYFADPEHQLAAMEFWAMGSFAHITQAKLFSMLPFFLIGIMFLFLLRWPIRLLSLSDEEAQSLGIPVVWVRYAIIFSATLVVASIVSLTGLIAFIGLIAPHISRMLTRKNDTHTFIISGLIGGVLLMSADTLARTLTVSELPISILTTFIGAPYLAYLMISLKPNDY